ncbi:C4-dicarboxylate TRAP transporter substrate-binding protein [Pseudohoeflea coraliihabitans]|uniref:C4-dicarboxylate TRAP transporter substrate-binding protein n=1 Tax=Pseudohoeflea coraliihabitans TaxID=2860393 RepID=A0ABS6WJ70_9HYPH|nr:C4-dicarboxylate TRAP transporter substrate-binding protein [Pseudohoeflea sp. DP4N28-3]MBW3095987.1 C4-dicarboxylate TRAP transporter substrate-binding protein [Pseudohoeflea sp. DP4N28-3]
MKIKGKFAALLAATFLSALTAGTASAKDLTMAPGFAAGSTVSLGAEAFTSRVNELTDGEITFTTHDLTLLSVPQMLNGVRDGVADVGVVLPMVFAAQFKESNLIGDLAMMGKNAAAMAGATTEYMMTCDLCLAEYANNNVVYLGSGSTPDYAILSTKPFTSLEDIKGSKLRSPNATFNRWVENFGGVALTLPGNEIFEAVKQGVVDGALLSAGELYNIRMIDVVKHVTLGVPGGTYNLINIATVNRDTWQGLTEDQRQAMIDASAHAIAVTTVGYMTDATKAIEEAKTQGIEVHEASSELVQATADFVSEDLAQIATLAAERGVEDAETKIARFEELVGKWEKLMEGVEPTADNLSAVYKSEIFDKLDTAEFGM